MERNKPTVRYVNWRLLYPLLTNLSRGLERKLVFSLKNMIQKKKKDLASSPISDPIIFKNWYKTVGWPIMGTPAYRSRNVQPGLVPNKKKRHKPTVRYVNWRLLYPLLTNLSRGLERKLVFSLKNMIQKNSKKKKKKTWLTHQSLILQFLRIGMRLY